MRIAAILAEKGGSLIYVRPSDSLHTALKLLVENRIGAVPVIDGELTCSAIRGILSERDVTHVAYKRRAESLDLPVSHAMTACVPTIRPGDSVESAMEMMTNRRIRHLPVIDSDDVIIGIVSIGDLVKARIQEAEQEALQLKDYIAGA